MLKGRVKMLFDVSGGVGRPINMVFTIYVEGQYFGDSDVFTKDKKYGRDSTAMADSECHILVIDIKSLFKILRRFKDIMLEMKTVARERLLHHHESKDVATERYHLKEQKEHHIEEEEVKVEVDKKSGKVVKQKTSYYDQGNIFKQSEQKR